MAAAKENCCYCKNDVGRLLFMVDGLNLKVYKSVQKPIISVYSSKWFSLTAIQLYYAQIVFINEQNMFSYC